nr:Fic family protein [Nanoarchaeum sp.]
MHIEKRKENGKIKYYLSHSYREGSKGHKIRKYLGLDLSKEKIEERKQIAEKLILEEIKSYKLVTTPIIQPLSKEQIEQIQNLQDKVMIKIKHLSEEQWSRFTEIFTYNTNAIEGSELNSRDVKEILEQNKWPDKEKNDIAEAYGVQNAINYIRKNKEHISLDLIKGLHKIVFENSKNFAGKFRKRGEDVVIKNKLGQIIHIGASQTRIISLLNELIVWYYKNKAKYPTLVLAAVVHNQFEHIHPFADGNGRIGRLLLNNILIKNDFPPVNIDLTNRLEYYSALRAYDSEKDIKPMIDLILKEYKKLSDIYR